MVVVQKTAILLSISGDYCISFLTFLTCHSSQKPAKLRHLLEQHGTVTRVYCAPEGLCVSVCTLR